MGGFYRLQIMNKKMNFILFIFFLRILSVAARCEESNDEFIRYPKKYAAAPKKRAPDASIPPVNCEN